MLARQVTKRQSKIVEIQDIDDSNVNEKLNRYKKRVKQIKAVNKKYKKTN